MTTATRTLDELTTSARDASAGFAATPRTDRAALLSAIADALETERDDLVAIADQETSLGTVRLNGEVARTAGQLRLFSQVIREGGYLEAVIDHADPAATPPKPDLRRYLVPIGPVAVFSASNFPFAFSVAGGDTASALAAGCPVIVKGHSGHPRLSRRVAEVVSAVVASQGLHEGVFGHVEGRENGVQLVQDPAIQAVGFTGSLSAGRALFDLAVGRPDPIPFYGELSSINPVVVSSGAVQARGAAIAQGLVDSVTLGVGQFCTKPGLVFIPADGELDGQVSEAVGEVSDGARMLSDRMLASYRDDLGGLMGIDGVHLIAGAVTEVGASSAVPAILGTDVEVLRANLDTLTSECFGPTTVLVRYSNLEALVDAVKSLPGALVGCLHLEQDEHDDLAAVLAALENLAGRVVIDGWPTGVAVAWSMNHGGPWPATTNALHTSVGATAIRRFLRPLTFQGAPADLLPSELKDPNPLGIPRRVDGELDADASGGGS